MQVMKIVRQYILSQIFHFYQVSNLIKMRQTTPSGSHCPNVFILLFLISHKEFLVLQRQTLLKLF